MGEREKIERFEQAVRLLPQRLQRGAMHLPDWAKEQTEEFRLRAGQPLTALGAEGEFVVEPEAGNRIEQTDLEMLCDRLTDYSRYAAAQTLCRGYLTARGGFRVGICGTAVMRGGDNTNIKAISSMTIRIGREIAGASDSILPQLFDDGAFCSTLLLSPPGAGKTTLLRDLVRNLSNGTADFPAHRVSVVDERGEIALMVNGMAQVAIGCHTDVLDGCPKAVGIPIMLRSANPQIIAVDEITVAEDIAAMTAAANCGVALLATIHARDRQEIEQKALFAHLMEEKVFRRMVTIRKANMQREYQVETLC
jgi:stage III sporulation protein AA